MAQREDPTRTRILEAAGAVFAQQGFEKATIREICRRAEVNLASANYHFGDKQRLYAATIRHAHEMAVTQVPLPEWPSDTPPEKKLRDMVRTMIQRMLVVKRLPWEAQLMMREFAQPTGACRELAEEYIKPHFQLLLDIINELVPAETPLHRRHQLAFSLVGQCLFYRFNEPIIQLLVPSEELASQFHPNQLAEHISQVMLSALGVEPLFSLSAEPPQDIVGARSGD